MNQLCGLLARDAWASVIRAPRTKIEPFTAVLAQSMPRLPNNGSDEGTTGRARSITANEVRTTRWPARVSSGSDRIVSAILGSDGGPEVRRSISRCGVSVACTAQWRLIDCRGSTSTRSISLSNRRVHRHRFARYGRPSPTARSVVDTDAGCQ
jgi:hypothetical protein